MVISFIPIFACPWPPRRLESRRARTGLPWCCRVCGSADLQVGMVNNFAPILLTPNLPGRLETSRGAAGCAGAPTSRSAGWLTLRLFLLIHNLPGHQLLRWGLIYDVGWWVAWWWVEVG